MVEPARHFQKRHFRWELDTSPPGSSASVRGRSPSTRVEPWWGGACGGGTRPGRGGPRSPAFAGPAAAGEELCSRGSSYLTLVFLPPSSSVRLKTGPGPPGKSPEIKEENKGPGPSHGPFSGHSNSTSKGVPLIPKKPENTILCEVPWWSGKAEIAPSSCLA